MLRLFLILFLALAPPVVAQDTPDPNPAPETTEPPMTGQRLMEVLWTIDPDATRTPRGIGLTITDVPVLVVFDEDANRMRAMVPVASAEGLVEADLMRMMQANFDTAMDARYAVANGRLWSVFIHPLRELEREQLLSGLAQTVTLARTYGTFYASGATQFGAGDSGPLHDELLEDLLRRGEEL